MTPVEEPELDLGLPPGKPKRAPVSRDYRVQEKQAWAKYTAAVRKFCDLCFDQMPRVNGVPEHVIPRAAYTEDGPSGRMWLCSRHKTERENDYSLRTAAKREADRQDRKKKRRR